MASRFLTTKIDLTSVSYRLFLIDHTACTRVIIYPEKASMATLSTLYTNWAHVLGLKIHLRRPFCFCVEASYFCMLCYAVKSCQIWLKL